MRQNVSVTPGKLSIMSARIGAVVAAMFLIFGLTFGYVVLNDMGPGGDGERLLTTMFFVIWVVVCGLIIFSLLRVGFAKGTPEDNSIVELKFEDGDDRTDRETKSHD